jgi:uncharacterized LabA/DUF88 family protein
MSQNLRVIVFIDGSNIYWGLRNYNNTRNTKLKLDYKKLVDYCCNSRYCIRAYYYCSAPVPPPEEQIKFLDKLRFTGIQVVDKKLKLRKDEQGKSYTVEKGVDVAMVIDFLSLAWENAYDVAIIVSGDADFCRAIEKVKEKGKRVEVVSFKDSMSGEIRRVSDATPVIIDDIIDNVKL